jgi:hypothetical protein
MGSQDSAPGNAVEADVVVADRHCGRCQRAYPGDPSLYFQNGWGLCPECTEILLPRPTHGAHVGDSHAGR